MNKKRATATVDDEQKKKPKTVDELTSKCWYPENNNKFCINNRKKNINNNMSKFCDQHIGEEKQKKEKEKYERTEYDFDFEEQKVTIISIRNKDFEYVHNRKLFDKKKVLRYTIITEEEADNPNNKKRRKKLSAKVLTLDDKYNFIKEEDCKIEDKEIIGDDINKEIRKITNLNNRKILCGRLGDAVFWKYYKENKKKKRFSIFEYVNKSSLIDEIMGFAIITHEVITHEEGDVITHKEGDGLYVDLICSHRKFGSALMDKINKYADEHSKNVSLKALPGKIGFYAQYGYKVDICNEKENKSSDKTENYEKELIDALEKASKELCTTEISVQRRSLPVRTHTQRETREHILVPPKLGEGAHGSNPGGNTDEEYKCITNDKKFCHGVSMTRFHKKE